MTIDDLHGYTPKAHTDDAYSKSAKDSIPAHVLRKIAEEMGYVTP